ncbi:MAG: sigma-70 family RNA polymerase sigma factor, partial [Thermoanaerobaculia bacterium]
MEPDGISPDQEADLEALEMVRRGDEAGAARLFRRWSTPLLRFTGRMLGDPSEAEEVTQDVFLKVIARAGQFDGRASVASWLFAIAANACRDRLRRSARRPS